GNWDLAKVKDAFAAAGIDPIAHYLAFGKVENLTPAEVTGDERVPSDGRTDGKTFTLTTAPDNIVGTAGNDVIDGFSAAGANAATDTLSIVDKIDGGAGIDTLNVTNSATGTATAGAQIKNV